MIQERGKVVSVLDDIVVIETSGKKSCVKCSNGNGCGAGALHDFFGRKNHSLNATSTVPVSLGDMVVVEVPERAILLSAGLMYLLPVVTMLLAVLMVKVVTSDPAELIQILFACVGLATGIFLSRHFSKYYLKTGLLEPKVVAHCVNG